MGMIADITPAAITARMTDSARLGAAAVASMLGGLPVPVAADAEHGDAACNFVGKTMFLVQTANGLHPQSAADFISHDSRGDQLARAFLLNGTVEVCCDYCGQLMTAALAEAAARQMRAVHGENAAIEWDRLCHALTGPPPPLPF